jgi:hypothetical protein
MMGRIEFRIPLTEPAMFLLRKAALSQGLSLSTVPAQP